MSSAYKKCKECGSMSLYISWSRLRTYEACKQAGYLSTVQKVKQPPMNHKAFFGGSVTDRVVRHWLENDPHNNPNTMPDMVLDFFESVTKETTDSGNFIKWDNAEQQDKVKRDCVEAVTKIEPALNRLVLPYDYVPDYGFRSAVNFPHPKGGKEMVVLNGYMDILVHDKDKDRWFVYDVKHTRNEQYWRKTLGQLSFYDLAVYINEGKQATNTALLQPLCSQEVYTFQPSKDSLRDLMMRVGAMARDMWSHDAPPRADNSQCKMCNVSYACSKFKPVNIDGKRKLPFTRKA